MSELDGFICNLSTMYIVLVSFELHRLRTFGAKFNIWLIKIDFKLTIYAKIFNSFILRFYVQNYLAIFIFVALICPSRHCLSHYHNQLQKWSATQTCYVLYDMMKLVLTTWIWRSNTNIADCKTTLGLFYTWIFLLQLYLPFAIW